MVATVINQNIECRNLGFEKLPKFAISLVADKDPCLVIFINFTGLFNIDSIDTARGTEIMLSVQNLDICKTLLLSPACPDCQKTRERVSPRQTKPK